MKKLVTVALALALAAQLSLPAIAQTTGIAVATAYPGLTVEPGDTAGFDLAITAPSNTMWLWPSMENRRWDGSPSGRRLRNQQVTGEARLVPEVRLDVIVPTAPRRRLPLTIMRAQRGNDLGPVNVTVQGGPVLMTMTPEFPDCAAQPAPPSPSKSTSRTTPPPRAARTSPAKADRLAGGGAAPGLEQASSITIDPVPPAEDRTATHRRSAGRSYELRVTARGGGVDAGRSCRFK